ncbi:MAG: conserved phage C-terminal domain-containing protein [Coriobacteriia bacterium]|nr:conserved phage C-terminal domain-containing protein [Coriobacteriia bacterium]
MSTDDISVYLATKEFCTKLHELSGKRYSVNNVDTQASIKQWVECGYKPEHFVAVAQWCHNAWFGTEEYRFFRPLGILGKNFEDYYNAAFELERKKTQRANRELDEQKREADTTASYLKAVEFLCEVKAGTKQVTSRMELVYNQCRGVHRFFSTPDGVSPVPRWRSFKPSDMPEVEYIRDCGDGVSLDLVARYGNGYASLFWIDLMAAKRMAAGRCDWYEDSFSDKFLEKLALEREFYPVNWKKPKVVAV